MTEDETETSAELAERLLGELTPGDRTALAREIQTDEANEEAGPQPTGSVAALAAEARSHRMNVSRRMKELTDVLLIERLGQQFHGQPSRIVLKALLSETRAKDRVERALARARDWERTLDEIKTAEKEALTTARELETKFGGSVPPRGFDSLPLMRAHLKVAELKCAAGLIPKKVVRDLTAEIADFE